MEKPFIGKKVDVLNKKGIVSLFRGQQDKALNYWLEAKTQSDRHFDSQCNYCMHRWSTGKITNEQLIEELTVFVFGVQGKGQLLNAAILIAQGEKEPGLALLK
jgi:hypothetical protein